MRHVSILLFLLAPAIVSAQGIIINEIYNSGGSDEWVELLIVEPGLDLRGWDLRDFTSGGSPQDPLSFSSNSFWSGFGSGTLILVVKPTVAIEEDFDPADFLVVIKSDNSDYFEGPSFSFAGTSDAIQIRNGADEHISGISWGSNNENSLPDPKVHFDKTSSSNTSISFLGDTTSVFPDPGSWLWNNAAPTAGSGNSPENSAWREELIFPANGSGMIDIRPDTTAIMSLFDLEVTFFPDPDWDIEKLRVVLPSSFPWSRNPEDVAFIGADGSMTLSGDTISLINLTSLQDSVIISVFDIGAGDSAGSFDILVQSGITAFVTVHPVPSIVVSGTTGAEPVVTQPTDSRLYPGYPNPFNSMSRIGMRIGKAGHVSLRVYDLLGREVATLLDEAMDPGTHEVTWDAGTRSSGVYLLRLRAGSYVETRKLMLMR